jgi:hypothetical protein
MVGDSIGTAYVELTVDGSKFRAELKRAEGEALKSAQNIEKGLGQTQSAVGSLSGAVGSLGTKFAGLAAAVGSTIGIGKAMGVLKDSIMLTASVNTLDKVIGVIGRNAKYTKPEMDSFVKGVMEMGITTKTAYQTVIRMAQAQQDLSKSTQLARVAQDAAVIGQVNSSEALERLLHGITTLQPEILRTIGITVTFENEYKKWADANKRTIDSLSQEERQMIALNSVLEQGTKIRGTYEAAMGTVGKVISSMSRFVEELQKRVGETFQPALKSVVDWITKVIERMSAWYDKMKAAGKVDEWAETLNSAVKTAISVMEGLWKVTTTVISVFYEFKDVAIMVAGVLGTVWLAQSAVFASSLVKTMGGISTLIWGLKNIGFVAAYAAEAVAGALTASLAALASPAGLVILGLAALAGGVYLVYDHLTAASRQAAAFKKELDKANDNAKLDKLRGEIEATIDTLKALGYEAESIKPYLDQLNKIEQKKIELDLQKDINATQDYYLQQQRAFEQTTKKKAEDISKLVEQWKKLKKEMAFETATAYYGDFEKQIAEIDKKAADLVEKFQKIAGAASFIKEYTAFMKQASTAKWVAETTEESNKDLVERLTQRQEIFKKVDKYITDASASELDKRLQDADDAFNEMIVLYNKYYISIEGMTEEGEKKIDEATAAHQKNRERIVKGSQLAQAQSMVSYYDSLATELSRKRAAPQDELIKMQLKLYEELLAKQVEYLNSNKDLKYGTQEWWNHQQAIQTTRNTIAQLTAEIEKYTGSATEGFRRAFADYYDSLRQSFTEAYNLAKSIISKLEDAIVSLFDLTRTKAFSWKDTLKSIYADINKYLVRQFVIKPVVEGLFSKGGILGGIGGALGLGASGTDKLQASATNAALALDKLAMSAGLGGVGGLGGSAGFVPADMANYMKTGAEEAAAWGYEWVDTTKESSKSILDTAKGLWDGLVNGFSSMGSSIMNFLSSLFSGGGGGSGLGGIGSWFGSLFSSGGGSSMWDGIDLPAYGYAEGGQTNRGRPIMVGERGVEMFVPQSAGSIIPNRKLGGNTTSIDVPVNVTGSGRDDYRMSMRLRSEIEQTVLRVIREVA